MIQIWMLIPVGIRIGVVQNPLVLSSRHVSIVAVLGHIIKTNDLNFIRAVLIQIEALAMRRMPCPGHDVLRIAPNKMRRRTPGIDAEPILTFAITGERPRLKRRLARVSPAIQKEET